MSKECCVELLLVTSIWNFRLFTILFTIQQCCLFGQHCCIIIPPCPGIIWGMAFHFDYAIVYCSTYLNVLRQL